MMSFSGKYRPDEAEVLMSTYYNVTRTNANGESVSIMIGATMPNIIDDLMIPGEVQELQFK